MDLAQTLALSVVAVCGSIFIHYEVVRALTWLARKRALSHRTTILAAINVLVVAHIAEIALFGVAFFVASQMLRLGTFVNPRSMSTMDYFYYAAETYSSLGYGDIYPLGAIRLLASVTPLIGLLLLGWSSALLVTLMKTDEVSNVGPRKGRDRGVVKRSSCARKPCRRSRDLIT